MERSGVRRARVAAIAVLVGAFGLTSCQVAKAGARCATKDWGRDSRYVLQCRSGTWVRVMTIADYLRLVERSRTTTSTTTTVPDTTTTTAPTGPTGGTDPTTTSTTTTSTSTTTTSTTTTSTTTTTTRPGQFTGVFPEEPISSWRVNGEAMANVIVGNTVYVGGTFTTATSPNGATSVARTNLAAFDLTTGELRGSFVADTDGMVRDLMSDGNRLYLGGNFTTVNGQARPYLAAVDLTTGAVSSWAPTVNGAVWKIGIGGGKLFLGGNFNWVGGQFHNHVAAVYLSNGTVDSGFTANVDMGLTGLAVSADGNRVYVGGAYTMINGQPAATLNALDGDGNLLPITFTNTSGAAFDIKVISGTQLAVAAGGEVGGNYVGIWNPTTGQRRWRQFCGGDGQAVAVLGQYTYGGFHDECELDTTIRLTKYATSNGVRDANYLPSFDKFWGIRDINGDASVMVIAGDFNWISGVRVGGFAIFRATA